MLIFNLEMEVWIICWVFQYCIKGFVSNLVINNDGIIILFLLICNIPLEQNKVKFPDFILLAPTELLFLFVSSFFFLSFSIIRRFRCVCISFLLLLKLQSRLIVSPKNLACLTQWLQWLIYSWYPNYEEKIIFPCEREKTEHFSIQNSK